MLYSKYTLTLSKFFTMNRYLLLCGFVMLANITMVGQSWMENDKYVLNFKQRHEGGFYLGMSTYQGDLNSVTYDNLSLFTELNTAIGLNYAFNITNQFSVGVNYLTTKLAGSDNNYNELWHNRRGFSFTNTVHEVALRADYEPFKFQKSKVKPYLFGGVGVVVGNAKTDFLSGNFNDKWSETIAIDNANRKNSSLVIPLGAGLRYYITPQISIKMEAAFRVGMNDYLDGVSASGQPSPDTFGSGGISFIYGFGKVPAQEKEFEEKPTDLIKQ